MLDGPIQFNQQDYEQYDSKWEWNDGEYNRQLDRRTNKLQKQTQTKLKAYLEHLTESEATEDEEDQEGQNGQGKTQY